LDSNGRFYNASGYPEDLFSNSTGETYDKKSQCFIEQYNNFTLTGVNDIQLPLDGQVNTFCEIYK
jgi:endothelin-converting enzyme